MEAVSIPPANPPAISENGIPSVVLAAPTAVPTSAPTGNEIASAIILAEFVIVSAIAALYNWSTSFSVYPIYVASSYSYSFICLSKYSEASSAKSCASLRLSWLPFLTSSIFSATIWSITLGFEATLIILSKSLTFPPLLSDAWRISKIDT